MDVTKFEDWSAHHEVPRELATPLDFANTLDLRRFGDYHPREFLPDPTSLDAWLTHQGFTGSTSSTADHAQALDLRAGIRELAESHHPGRPATEGPLPQDRPAFDLSLRARVDDEGRLTLTSDHRGTRAALAHILAMVVQSEATGMWARVKMCSAADCRVVYYDMSKARNSRWCSTTGCGNRVKTRAYRTRRRHERP